jgi:hypothetical protein
VFKIKKEKQVNIEFVSEIPELLADELILPKPTNKFIPEWYKKMPLRTHPSNFFGVPTIKGCPALSDLFGLGYVLPAWQDIALCYDKGVPLAKIGRTQQEVGHHPNNQFLDYAEHTYLNEKGKFVFKLNNPWQLITPKGWSVLQIPLFYNFDNNFSVLPGIIDTDVWHQINLQVVYYGSNEVVIQKGTPLVQYIPFKREKNNLVIRSITKEDDKRFKIAFEDVTSRFTRGYVNFRKRKHNER